MEKTYHPQSIEQRWYRHWEEAGYFIPRGENSPYCIMIPPPNVTGSLHMGHGFQDTLMDVLIRYKRMCGCKTLWQVGTDHAGISTQMVVERQLHKEGKNRYDLGREAFEKRVWQWKNETDSNITSQLRRIGTSVDWTRERFTLDEQMSRAVEEVFIRLYDEGLIYRGKRLVNWDPHFRTAISDLEVISSEEKGHLWYIRYPFVDGAGDDGLVVATTRPETMLGDVAVAVNPNDERFRHLVGKRLKLPLTDREIPIIADEYVEQEFGTGCVKITPAHDFNDNAVGKRHDLPLINIFTDDAHLNDNAPKEYRGLDRFDARAQIIKDLEQAGLLVKTEPHTLKIPRNDRGNTIVEPYLTDQWFVKIESLAKPAIDAVEKGEIRFVPETWKKTYFQWMHGIEDWCISRQLWWGHRIPAWYDEANNIYVGRNEEEVRRKYNLDPNSKLRQDEDVLDTWFSSALWPFATLGWPDNTPELENFYPTDVLVTGFDIIFFWVARMIMMGLKFTGKIPFKEIYITGLIRDSEGQKMSKSKGNVLDPINLIDGIELEPLITKRTTGLMQTYMQERIEKQTRKEFPDGIPPFGTDALRFTFCALATKARNINFDLKRLEGYRNFCNKLWNAARYVLMNVENQEVEGDTIELSLADRWITSDLQQVIQQVKKYLATYRFDLAANTLYEFTWHEFCDWYLELSKPVLTSSESSIEALRGTRQTLVNVLETLLRLMHPMMPFITEEIWQQLKPYKSTLGATIMLAPYPEFDAARIEPQASSDIEWLKRIIIGIRNIRGEMNISPNQLLPLLMHKGDPLDRERSQANQHFLMQLAKLSSIEWLTAEGKIPPSVTALAGDLELLVPMAGVVDKEAESKRLQKEIDKLIKDMERSEKKLTNPNYVEKAPNDVVEKERNKVSEMQLALSKLQGKLQEIKM